MALPETHAVEAGAVPAVPAVPVLLAILVDRAAEPRAPLAPMGPVAARQMEERPRVAQLGMAVSAPPMGAVQVPRAEAITGMLVTLALADVPMQGAVLHPR